jgi:hypothetical protein
MARVFGYERRENKRCPCNDFLVDIEKKMLARLRGQMDALTKQGSSYENHQRFCPLHGSGKPLWEFKEHDHRLYCARFPRAGGKVDVILYNGWKKDKEGKNRQEVREIEKAVDLHAEFLAEYPGGDLKL